MEQNSEPEWDHDIPVEVLLPFPIKEEKISSDEESEASSQPSKQHTSNQKGSLDNVQEHNSYTEVEKKRERTRFNIFQRAELEKAFIASPYLAPKQRLAVAARLGVKPVAVQSWFKNRRFKWRKEAREHSGSPSECLPRGHPFPKVCPPAMYQSPCVYNSGHISMARCQGCYIGNPTKKAYSAFFRYHPYV